MKRLIIVLLIAVMIFAGCSEDSTGNGSPVQISPVAEENTDDRRNVTLYYGDAALQHLIGAVKTVSVPVNESMEEAVLKKLIAGPDTQTGEILQLINSNTKVISVKETEGVLFVTLDENFLKWPTRPGNREEISDKQKQLAVYSVVNTMIELSGCPSVQLLIDISGSGMGQRIERAKVGFKGGGVLEPISYNSEIVLTAGNTVEVLFENLMAKDYDGAYRFIAQKDSKGDDKPRIGAFGDALGKHGATIEDFAVRETIAGADSNSAVVMIDYSIRTDNIEARMRTNIPVKTIRENNVWKVSYDTLANVLLME